MNASPTIYSNVMLDLETMGNGPNAAIVAIGAVCFDIEGTQISHDGFYARIDLASAMQAGGVIDASTITWWLQQSDAARAEITADDRQPITQALTAFAHWIDTHTDGAELWGNGASFDNVILRSAYQRAGILPPWAWWNDRCYRTLKALHRDVPIERFGDHHNALDDATTQAIHLLRILRPEYRGAPMNFAFPSPESQSCACQPR